MTFNFFEIIEFSARREEDYSAVLKWLLDPGETHGLGSEVLRSVLEKAGLPAEEICSSDPVTVDVERCYVDEGGQRRLDIVIDTKSWHVVIENKIREPAMGDVAKLESEYRAAREAKSDEKKFAFIYLYPDRFKDAAGLTPLLEAETATFKQLTWREVATILNGVAVEKPDLHLAAVFLEQFSEYIQERVDMVFKGFSQDKEIAFRRAIPEYQRAKAEFEKYKSVVSKEWKGYLEEVGKMLAKEDAVAAVLTGGGKIRELTSPSKPYAVRLIFDVEVPIPASIAIWLYMPSGEQPHESKIIQEICADLWNRKKDYPALDTHLEGYLTKDPDGSGLWHWFDPPKEHYHQGLTVPFDSSDWHASAERAVRCYGLFIKGLTEFYIRGAGKD